ncbi:uncharacterized protein K444DRAFT_718068 [Hyaloscypha bicolor E]|uniref:Uncharacterized protein n=1 Tax=Hyaloscypha bicolor E TaxID=1095630 RepID=A0A2J6TIT8_9HELO|nr:uncharacterized protein K444DRAFT_718068 [Hyaloscypha bicolor E]PMD62931.1 hypothetical protein K444DRAFT_718068 [Hyaloscypha bicolor E]
MAVTFAHVPSSGSKEFHAAVDSLRDSRPSKIFNPGIRNFYVSNNPKAPCWWQVLAATVPEKRVFTNNGVTFRGEINGHAFEETGTVEEVWATLKARHPEIELNTTAIDEHKNEKRDKAIPPLCIPVRGHPWLGAHSEFIDDASPPATSPPSLRTSGSIARRDAALMGVVTAEPVVSSLRTKKATISSSTWKGAKHCRLEYTSSYPSVLVSRSRPPLHHTFGHRIFRLGPLASGKVLGDSWLAGFEDTIMAWV